MKSIRYPITSTLLSEARLYARESFRARWITRAGKTRS